MMPTESRTVVRRAWLGRLPFVALALALAVGCAGPSEETLELDLILEGGTVYDGSGEPPVVADVGILGDRIAAIATSGTLGRRAGSTSPASRSRPVSSTC